MPFNYNGNNLRNTSPFRKIHLTSLLIIFCFSGFLSAQTSFLNFKSDFRILLKDSRGYLWGTDPDGRAYISDGNETRDLDRFIPKCTGFSAILETSDSMIWIGNRCEVIRYNPFLDRFDLLNSKIVRDIGMAPLKVNSFMEDSHGNIWLSTWAGLIQYDQQKDSFELASDMPYIQLTFEDGNGNIWLDVNMDVETDSLFKMNPESSEIIPIIEKPKQLYETFYTFWEKKDVIHLNEAKTDHLILCRNIVSRFHSDSLILTKVEGDFLPEEKIYCIQQHDDMILAGTSKGRIYRFLPDQNKFELYWYANSQSGTNIYRLYSLENGTWWAASNNKNYIGNSREKPFTFNPIPKGFQEPKQQYYQHLVKFQGKIYFFTKYGLSPVKPDKETPIIHLELPTQYSLDYHLAFQEDPIRPWLWVLFKYIYGDDQKLLCAFDIDGHLIKKYDFPSIKGGFHAIAFDNNNDLLIGTRYNWIIKFSPETEEFDMHPFGNNDAVLPLFKDGVTSILTDRNNQIWTGSSSFGVWCYDPLKDELKNYRHEPLDSNSLTGNVVKNILEDEDGNIWMGTNNGVTKWNPVTEKFKQYTHEHGLLETEARTLDIDKNGDIWISSYLYIYKYWPEEDRFIAFTAKDGIIGRGFNGYSSIDESGHLFIEPTLYGVWSFHPDSLTQKQQTPDLALTGFQVNNQSVLPAASDSILKKSIYFTDKVDLVYAQNNFSIQYAAFEYIHPDYIEYAYQLEGYDGLMQYVDGKREATYTGLPPGEYTFKVKCKSHQGFWGEPRSLTIIVHPPWYLTLWAKTFWVLLFLSALYFIYRFQLNRKLEQAEAQRAIELESAKSKLYTNITHEFRTPLTVIIGLAEKLAAESGGSVIDGWRKGLTTIKRNGKELLNLVNQLLDLAKLESGSLSVNLVQGDVIEFLKYLLESFQSLAASKDISLQFSSETDSEVMDYDEQKLQRIISNLVTNAIKFTPIGGQVKMHVGLTNFENLSNLLLTISDTGFGIPADRLDKVFDRFYHAPPQPTPTGKEFIPSPFVQGQEGAGIGLALTKELVHLLGGKIEVSSKLGEGTQFKITLPITHTAEKFATQKKLPPHYFEEAIPFVTESVSFNPSSTEKPLVLIIEDNLDVVYYLSTCLQDQYRLEAAKDGSEGIEMAIELVPDLIISDVMMPEKDGFEVCETLKNHEVTNHIPIILLTAKADEPSRLSGLQKGADAYLAKPFSKKELTIRLEKLIELRKNLQEKFSTFQTLTVQTASKPENEFLQRVRQVIEQDIGDAGLDIPQLAKSLAMSRTQLYRKLKALTGQSPSIFIRNLRLQKAKELLQTTNLNISQVAYETGFTDLSHFSRSFKEAFGIPPSEFREQ